VSKIVSTPGDVIKVTGQKFGSNLSLLAPEAASLMSDAPQPVAGKVTVVSDTEATVALPTSINFGLFTLSFLQDGVKQNVTLPSNGGKTDYPVMVTVPDKICAGDKFYDGAGVLRTATKNCAAVSLPFCSQDGGVGCVAVASYTAAATSGIAGKVLSGNTVAGIVGNVTLPTGDKVRVANGAFGVSGSSILEVPMVTTNSRLKLTNHGSIGVALPAGALSTPRRDSPI